MSTIWQAADELAQAAVADAFGEDLQIVPRMRGGDFSAASLDPERIGATVTGVVSSSIDDFALKGQVRGGEQIGPTRIAGAPIEVWISAKDAVALAYDLRAGDLIRLAARAGSPGYSVVRTYHSENGDLSVFLAGEAA